MKKADASNEAVIAAFIHKCNAYLQEQAERLGRWPDRLQLPEPRNDIEREALDLWIAEVREATGREIRIDGVSEPEARDAAPDAKKPQQIGVISVDAGLCWIGDPCYILHKSKDAKLEVDRPPQSIGNSWPDFVKQLAGRGPTLKQFNHDRGPGLGVVVSTGSGDGVYPVYAEIVDGPVARVWVDFTPEEA